VTNASHIEFLAHGGREGSLIAIENGHEIDFDIKRVYYIYGTPNDVTRGKHAHRRLQQVLICVSGSCRILLDNGTERETVLLNQPNHGIYLREFIWREMTDFSNDCVLLVLASELYDPDEYIRDYEQFRKEAEKQQ